LNGLASALVEMAVAATNVAMAATVFKPESFFMVIPLIP
jgi:hypothetical protein